jgi:molecular chaperone DnaK (HSP70)
VKRPGSDKKEAAAKEVKQQSQSKIICSIDFGTTYSGVAIVGSVNCGISDIEVLRNWKNGLYLEQVPSRIAYPEENPGLDKITFGYEVTSTMKSYTWMKLLLGSVEMDDFTETKFGTKAAHGMLELPPGKTAEDVVCDYLKCLYEHIMDHLSEESPGQMLEERPIEFWLTTPACWDDQTNSLTRKCALAAGFGSRLDDNLCMMREPDAALVANVSSSVDKHEGVYKVCHPSNT